MQIRHCVALLLNVSMLLGTAVADPDLSSVHERAVIIDRDIGQSDALFVDRVLTNVRQVKISP